MLTVAYVGNFTKPWCTENHVAASLEALGHRVVRLQENRVAWPALPARVAAEGVQLLLWTRTWAVPHDECLAALEAVRAQGVPSCFYHLDRWWGLEREYQVRSEPFFRMDLVVSPDGGNDERWAEAGVNHLWLPPGVYGAECVPVTPAPRRWPAEVVFVGSHPYPHAEWEPYRTELIETLAARYGRRFAVWAPADKRRQLRGRELTELYCTAKVVVGDSCLVGAPTRYWSDRIPETLGRGGLLIHPEVEGLEDWYTHERDLLTYPVGDFDAVCELVDRAIAEPEWAGVIRKQGQATVLGRDTYVHRMEAVLAEVGRQFGFPEREVPAPPPAPVEAHHRATRARASFVLAQGDTDAVAVREVWQNDDYRLTPADVRGKAVLDIGANVGAFSVLAAKAGARSVHAYEPHPANAAALRENIARNRVRVDVVEAAVLDRTYENAVHISGDGGGAHLAAPLTDSDKPEVRVVPIVEAVNIAAGTNGTLGLLKLDVEGSEYRIFSGHPDADPELWLARIERIVMEFHGPVMPHLTVLDADGQHLERWGHMVAMLADYGRVETFGHPRAGGLLWWRRY